MAGSVGVSSKGTGSSNTAVSAAVTTQASGSSFLAFYQTDTPHTGVTDNKGNTYTPIGTLITNSSLNSRFYYCENGAGGSGHTCTGTGQTGDHSILFIELLGILTSSALDQVASVLDSSSPFTVTSGSTTQADEISISAMSGNSTTTATHAESTGYTISQEVTTGGPNWTCAIAYKVLSSTGAQTPSWTEAGGTTAGVHVATFKAAAASSLEQEGARFRNDNGSETSATFAAAQDANITWPIGTALRLRLLINATLDPASQAFTLRVAKNGGAYNAVPIVSSVAASYGTVTFGAIGTAANGTTTVAPSYPAGITAGQYLTCSVTSGATNSETPTTPSGWTLLATGASTDGTYGVDTGPRRATVFGKIADGTETGTLTVAITNGDSCRASICRWTKAGSGTWTIEAQGGNDSTSGTGMSITFASMNWNTGDAALVTIGQRQDNATNSSQSLTASGVTFGTRTNRADTAVTTGNDHRHIVDTFAAVSGTSNVNAAPTYAFTASASVSAGGVVVRLREYTAAVTNEIYISPSSNITASGENTTAQLTAPSGKTTSDFVTGRMQDDENPADAIDITSDDYTEVEWNLMAQAPAANADVYSFRIYAGAIALGTYSVTPTWTIGSGAVTGNLAATESADVAAIVMFKVRVGTLAATESADVAAITGRVPRTGTLAATESPDVANIAGDVLVEGALAATESSDTAAIAGRVIVEGTLAATESSDVAAIAGDVLVEGALAATEASDVAAMTGNVDDGVTPITGTLAATESPDVAAMVGKRTTHAALAVTESSDTANIAGDVLVEGSLGATESPDVGNFSGFVRVRGSLAATEAPDTAAIAGRVPIEGALAATESPDVPTISGNKLTTGNLAATESSDVVAIAGDVIVRGTLAATESSDVVAMVGKRVTHASLAVLEASDVANLAGFVRVRGSLTATEASDVMVATAAPVVDGFLDALESSDLAFIEGGLEVCVDLVMNPRFPDLVNLIAAAKLDKYGRFAKTDADVYVVRLFYGDAYCQPSGDLTRAQFNALPRATRLTIDRAPSAAGLIDTEDKSNA